MTKELQLIGLNQLAEILCIDPRRVQQLAKEGVIPRLTKGQYPLVESIQGYIQYLQAMAHGRSDSETGYGSQRTKLTKLKAEIQEIQLRRMKNELVPINQVIEVWGNVVTNMRSKMLSIPAKIAPRMRATKSNAEAQTIIKKNIEQALAELAEAEIVNTDPS